MKGKNSVVQQKQKTKHGQWTIQVTIHGNEAEIIVPVSNGWGFSPGMKCVLAWADSWPCVAWSGATFTNKH